MMIKFLFGVRLFVISIAMFVVANKGIPHDESTIATVVATAVLTALTDASNVGRKQIVAKKNELQ